MAYFGSKKFCRFAQSLGTHSPPILSILHIFSCLIFSPTNFFSRKGFPHSPGGAPDLDSIGGPGSFFGSVAGRRARYQMPGQNCSEIPESSWKIKPELLSLRLGGGVQPPPHQTFPYFQRRQFLGQSFLSDGWGGLTPFRHCRTAPCHRLDLPRGCSPPHPLPAIRPGGLSSPPPRRGPWAGRSAGVPSPSSLMAGVGEGRLGLGVGVAATCLPPPQRFWHCGPFSRVGLA